jgi:5'-nucleotidase
MINKKPLIFISNDDGYQANGIRQLIEMLRPLGQILVMAPDSARSGSSMALTSSVPVKFRKICEEKDLVVFSCSGTPVDCTKLAFHVFFQDEKPDLVVAGINHGDNAAVNVHYSGTMGVTIEGCLKGAPSIAFSSFNKAKDADYSSYTSFVQKLTALVLDKGLPEGVCLNVNFPMTSVHKGVRICRQDKGNWVQEWEKYLQDEGSNSYLIAGDYISNEPSSSDTDRWAIENGYVAITPTTIDMTAYNMMNVLKDWFKE